MADGDTRDLDTETALIVQRVRAWRDRVVCSTGSDIGRVAGRLGEERYDLSEEEASHHKVLRRLDAERTAWRMEQARLEASVSRLSAKNAELAERATTHSCGAVEHDL